MSKHLCPNCGERDVECYPRRCQHGRWCEVCKVRQQEEKQAWYAERNYEPLDLNKVWEERS